MESFLFESSDIILIVGLPGSGKTSLAVQLGPDILIDDPKTIDEVMDHQNFNLMVITDPVFCMPRVLQAAIARLRQEYPYSTISCIYFENNSEQCKKNASTRADKNVTKYIEMLSEEYVPQGVLIPVYGE